MNVKRMSDVLPVFLCRVLRVKPVPAVNPDKYFTNMAKIYPHLSNLTGCKEKLTLMMMTMMKLPVVGVVEG